MDYVINLQIRDADPHEEEVAMPRKPDGELLGLYDDKYRGLDTHQVYMLLKEEGGGGGGAGEDGEGDGDGTGQGNGLGGGGSGQSDESSDGLDEHDWDGAVPERHRWRGKKNSSARSIVRCVKALF